MFQHVLPQRTSVNGPLAITHNPVKQSHSLIKIFYNILNIEKYFCPASQPIALYFKCIEILYMAYNMTSILICKANH